MKLGKCISISDFDQKLKNSRGNLSRLWKNKQILGSLKSSTTTTFWRTLYFNSAFYGNEVIHCSLKYGARAVVYCICVGVCI